MALPLHLIIPLAQAGKMVTVAMGDPFDVVGLESLHAITGLDLVPLARMAGARPDRSWRSCC